MNQASRGSRVVFVGNIPFELSEEQLIEVFKEVGPVASFRLLFDRDTGRPKGYGFCEFLDAETAASAVRNLNDYEIGGRQLRVDYAAMDDNQRTPNHHNNNRDNQNRHNQSHHPPPPMQQAAPSIPMPISKPQSNLSSVDEISKVLASMNSQDLFTLMSQMKQMSFERADFTREFLISNPQVAYALFQAMVMMNIVDPNIITRIMTANPVSQTTPTLPIQPTQTMPMQTMPMQTMPMQNMQTMPMQNMPMQTMPMQNMPMQNMPMQSMPMQPMQTMPMQNTRPIINNPVTMPHVEDETEQQKALLMKVLQLTDEQINALPPQTRDQIRQLKTQLTMQQS